MTAAPVLSDYELFGITRRRRPAAQARILDGWRVPYKRRPDGTLVVGRVAFDQAMSGTPPSTPAVASDGFRWTKPQ